MGPLVQRLMMESSVWVHKQNGGQVQRGPASEQFNRIVHGADNRGIQHVGFQVISILNEKVHKVERIENSVLWQRYAQMRMEIATRLQAESFKGNRAPVLRLDCAADWQSQLLLGGPCSGNEVLLFHGTESEAVEKILHDGLDPRVSSAGLFGHGLYFAENASKSDEYTRPDSNGRHVMFLSRVLLGRLFRHEGSSVLTKQGDASRSRVSVFPGKMVSLGALLRAPYLDEFAFVF